MGRHPEAQAPDIPETGGERHAVEKGSAHAAAARGPGVPGIVAHQAPKDRARSLIT